MIIEKYLTISSGNLSQSRKSVVTSSADSLPGLFDPKTKALIAAVPTVPYLSLALSSNDNNNPKKKEDKLVTPRTVFDNAEANAMIEVLSKYKCKSTGNLGLDVSTTIVECFKALLQINTLQNDFAKEMKSYMDSHEDWTKDQIIQSFLATKFSPSMEAQAISKIIESAAPNSMEMKEVVQEMVVDILGRWGFSIKASRDYAKQAFTKRYEEGVLKGISLTGWVSK